PAFSARETLIKTISRADVHLVLPDLYDIIRQRKKEHEHIIRVSALRIVATYQLPYFMQTVLEQLSRLSVEQASDFTRLLSAYPGKEFAQRVDELLEQNDSKIRAMLMMSLPAEEKKRIYPHIEIALRDSDPDVRIAAISAHVEVSQQGYPDLLRDPVTRVRETAACVMGKYADKKILHQLRNLVSDENEEEVVKIAAVKGIASSAEPLSIHLLVDILAETTEGDALYDEVCRGLQSMTDTARLRLLIAELKNAEVALRKKLVAVFVSMKEDAEPFFVEVLKNDSISLRAYIIETLEKSGYFNSVIRRLTQRNVNVRREAAEFLLLAGTFTSYRGLIQACRDPDEDIRILVTRALDYLASEDGRDILAELRSDPSRRVRRYTHWALERFEARK
ncbi:MAG: HEAT repeat domain-containing protein, partial [Salinispira sp.]